MKTFRLIFKIRRILLFGIIGFLLSAYKKEVGQNEERRKSFYVIDDSYKNYFNIIYVSNINELYTAVNNTANTDTRIVMAAGTYILDPIQLNGGRLELQEGMELRGQVGDPEKVKIDESGLPASSFKPSSGIPKNTGGIRIGRGFNSIEWLTVIGNSGFDPSTTPKTPFALSAIDTDLDSDSTHVRLAHLIVKNSCQIGIDIRNSGATSSGRFIEADIFDNEIFDNKNTANPDASGNGITIQNSNGATGAVIIANLVKNYVHGNNTGIRSHNQHTNSASITIKSKADRFDGNGIGIILNAGLDINKATTITTANRNFLNFEANATSVRKNINPLPPDNPPPCGIYIAGAVSTQVSNRTSYNTLEMKLRNCFISGNKGFIGSQIKAFGARSPLSTVQPGTNNLVTIDLGVGWTVLVSKINRTDSDPVEPGGTNVVTVL